MEYTSLITLLFIGASAQENYDCYEEGGYQATIHDFTKQGSVDSCANHCAFQPPLNCGRFTYDPNNNLCMTFTGSYREVDTTYCPDCLRSTRGHFCGLQGFCKVKKWPFFYYWLF